MKPLELYIHIPFCVKKCKYCDFYSGPSTEAERESYVMSLCQTIRSYGELAKAYRVTSIFVGGGTPSILKAEQMEAIFLAIRETFIIEEQAEITIEMNPGTVDEKKLRTYKTCGINRLSIGLQSTDNRELRILGRIHTYEEFLNTYRLAREGGFQNINIDLMSAIPGQSLDAWKKTLEAVAKLEPEHISAYNLIIEEGTPFYDLYGEVDEVCEMDEKADSVMKSEKLELPDEETERQMYHETIRILKEYGYRRYEISNYAKPGYECRHNLGYWNRTEYLGIGESASSLIRNYRFTVGTKKQNSAIQDEKTIFIQNQNRTWMNVQQGEIEILSTKDEMEEYMFLGLRKTDGVSVSRFEELFGKPMHEVYDSVIRDMEAKGLLIKENDTVKLTDRGMDVANYVMSEFLL